MTLFHLRELWSTQCGISEEFDKTSLCICNVDNDSAGYDKIVTASFNGVLRVYSISFNTDQEEQNENQQFSGQNNQYQAADLLLEVDFKEPILQISSGVLLANSAKIQLAVLHPRRFAVYSISSTSGAVDQGTAYNVLLIYEHVFDHLDKTGKGLVTSSAVSCLLGTFGQHQQQTNANGSQLQRAAVCIQHSGSLHFYENEAFSFAFSRGAEGAVQGGGQAANNLKNRSSFPGELAHIGATRGGGGGGSGGDLLVMTGDDGFYTVECYRYQELAMANLLGGSSGVSASASFAKMTPFSRDSQSFTEEMMTPNSQSSSVTIRPPTNASTTNSLSSTSASEASRGSGVVPEWVYAFGETVLAMETVCLEGGSSNQAAGISGGGKSWFIVLLGERNLAVLRENGSLWFVKRFDVSPSALCAYAAGDALVTIVGTHLCNLLLYTNDALRWATKVAFVPVAIRRAHFAAISGALVLLSDEGALAVGYLGTNPSLKVIPMPASAPLGTSGSGSEEEGNNTTGSTEKMAEDLKELKKVVAAYHLEGNGSAATEAENSRTLALYLDLLFVDLSQDGPLLTVNLELSSMASWLGSGTPLTITFFPSDFYDVSPQEVTLPNGFEKGKAEVIELRMRSKVPLPLSPKIKCTVLLHNEEGAVRVVKKTIRLPLEGLVQRQQRMSSSQAEVKGQRSQGRARRFSVKVLLEGKTIEEVRSAVFGGGLLSSEELTGGSASEVCLHFRSNPSMEATVRVAPSEEGRGGGVALQVEGNQVASLYRVLREVRRRLLVSSSTTTAASVLASASVVTPPTTSPSTTSTSSSIVVHSLLATLQPVDALCAKIERRLAVRAAVAVAQASLDRFSAHYRVLQKRILVKLKDRQPSSLAHFEKLLKTVTGKINDLIEQIGKGQAALAALNYQIWAHLKLLKVLLKLQLSCSPSRASATAGSRRLQTILKLLAVQQMSDFGKNWEEQLETSLLSTLQLDRDIAHLAVVLDYEEAHSMASVQGLQTTLRAAAQAFTEQTGVSIQVV